ncbi:MAG: AAA family ATPase [Tessaracoccus sp.]|uniref:UvrD-helicase domain-containing protein n=1 Tax=Tessaracoccus sp. TaxID=1971211 RepID=UPI001ED6F64E|nr:UvrD-helicase domain-containing protein [Tessaracoccus sp.]MBK7823493.1 AAA family ATPase [Tessaracoccus sp.]
MARLAISKDYFPAYARLPRKAQRKADEFLRKFEQDSTALSIHLEPIRQTVDRQLRSARIGDDYRVILRAPEHGDVFLVLWADHHDEAYRWAETKQTAIHPATGSLQIFDVTEAAVAVAVPPAVVVAPPVVTGLFAAQSDDDLFLAGVPRALVPSVRALVTDEDLDRLLPHLPPEAGEVLTALAAGIDLDDALEEVLGRTPLPAAAPPPPAIDVTDLPAALARDTSQRQFRLLEDGLDLDTALKYPLDVWRVFLHPRQRRLARARTKGPTRVLGGAGTGKTVVALHRVAFLVREVFTRPDDRVLLTTFNVNLASDLQAQLAKLLEPDHLARVEVVNLDAWASRYLRSRGISVRPAFEKDQRTHFDAAYEVYGHDDVSLDFYRMEWREVIQEQGLTTLDEYVRTVRKSRGVPLGRAERRRLWPVFEAYRENLAHAGLTEPLDILRRARVELERAGKASGYCAVVVDETQDFAADGLRLIRAIAGPERPDDLFLVGDAHQRIYARPISLSQCGITVRGRRSQTLRLNYRTTGAICRWSLAVLKDVTVDDLDDGQADRRGYVSLREGPAPEIHPCGAPVDEERTVVALVRTALDSGTPPESICVVARTQAPLRDRFIPALERAGVAAALLEQDEPRHGGVRLATMHRVKGLEFEVVVLVCMSRYDVPHATPESRSDDPVMNAQALLRERSLVYVAASRARDALHVCYSGEPSPLLTTIAAPRTEIAPAAAPSPRVVPALVSVASPVAPAGVDQLTSLLARQISDLALPTRMKNWARRAGLSTLGELAHRSPADLLAQPNLGRKSVNDTRAFFERATGRRWEDLAGGAQGTTISDEVYGDPWDALRATLTDADRTLPLDTMEMPGRLRSFIESRSLVTLGDLASHSRAALDQVDNLGRTTLASLPALVTEFLDATARAAALIEEGLLECFQALLEPLDPGERLIATRRAGLGGEPMTLQELGDEIGVSRERVRQVEARLCGRLAHQPWALEARRRIAATVAAGPVPFATLAGDRWWASASAQPDVVAFIVDSVLGLEVRVIELDDLPWLSPQGAATISAALSDLLSAAAKVRLPGPLEVFDALASQAGASFGPHVATYLRDELRSQLQLGDGTPPRVLAFGDTRAAELLATLRGSPTPVRLDELQRQLGRRLGKLPDEVMHFDRGVVGLRRHFPDFEAWQTVLVPAAVKLIETTAPDRQWYCGEILDELRETIEVPEWMTPFGLAALIKATTGALRYLGRLRVVLPDRPDSERRVYVHDAIEALLQEAGEPMLRSELVERLDQQMGMSSNGLMALQRPQFVRVDLDRVGLLARDVPGGAPAISEACAHLEALLARRGRGLSEFHAHQALTALAPSYQAWTAPLTMSILRADGRFRMSMNGAVGLATWDSTRVPTRLQLVRAALDESGGHVSVEAVLARIEAHYGDRPLRPALHALAMHAHASVDGDWLSDRPAPPANLT